MVVQSCLLFRWFEGFLVLMLLLARSSRKVVFIFLFFALRSYGNSMCLAAFGVIHSYEPIVAHEAGAYLRFLISIAWSDWEYFYSPLDEVLAHRWVIPSIKLAGTHLYSWLERGTMRFKCLAQEHNTMSPARVWTQTARSGFERTDHFSRLIYIQTVFPISGFNLSSQFVRNELLLSRSFCLDLNLDL